MPPARYFHRRDLQCCQWRLEIERQEERFGSSHSFCCLFLPRERMTQTDDCLLMTTECLWRRPWYRVTKSLIQRNCPGVWGAESLRQERETLTVETEDNEKRCTLRLRLFEVLSSRTRDEAG